MKESMMPNNESPQKSIEEQIKEIIAQARGIVVDEHESSDDNSWLECLGSIDCALRFAITAEVRTLQKDAENNQERIQALSGQLSKLQDFSKEWMKRQNELQGADPSEEEQEALLNKLENIFA